MVSQVFTRSEQLANQIHDIRLKIPEWKILFTVDGVMGSDAIADFLGISEREVLQTLEKLNEMQLISKMGEQKEEEAKEDEMTFGEELSETPDLETHKEDFEPEEIEKESETQEQDKEVDGGRIELSGVEEEDREEIVTEEEPLSLEEEEGAEESTELEEEATESAEKSIESVEEPTESKEETGESEVKEEEPLSDQEFDKFIGGLLNEEEEKESTGLETEEPSLESEMPPEIEEEKEEADLEFGDFFQEESGESEVEVEEEEQPELPEEEEVSEEKAEPEVPPAEELPGKEKTILVVDDSVVIRKMVEIALENEQYNIMSVATGKEALQYLDENTPDLIILDIMLPDVNGLDVLKAVKASKQIPVVMLSAKDTPRETSKAKELGANDFIPKPFKDEELVSKVKELVSE